MSLFEIQPYEKLSGIPCDMGSGYVVEAENIKDLEKKFPQATGSTKIGFRITQIPVLAVDEVERDLKAKGFRLPL